MSIYNVFLFLSFIIIGNECAQHCLISLDNRMEFSDLQPLILKVNSHAFYYPENIKGDIRFSSGEPIFLACPGKLNAFKFLSAKKDLTAVCSENNQFNVDGHLYTFADLHCKEPVENVAKLTGAHCWNNNLEVVIGFELANNQFINLIRLCHDDNVMATLYTHSVMTATIGAFQKNMVRPYFVEGIFYNKTKKNLNSLYQRHVEQKTFSEILESNDLGLVYINEAFVLTRGHLVARADFVYTSQQRATFNYINTAPQWESFNAGNWNDLEMSVRNYSSNKYCDLDIFTGTLDICTLPNMKGVQTPVYLLKDGNFCGIPVPKYFWKVVYHAQTKKAIALIGLNNPHQCEDEDIFCTDICNQVNWVSWNRKNINGGYSFCCDVNQFRNFVPFLPSFPVTGILT